MIGSQVGDVSVMYSYLRSQGHQAIFIAYLHLYSFIQLYIIYIHTVLFNFTTVKHSIWSCDIIKKYRTTC